jgi:hypothetical protein
MDSTTSNGHDRFAELCMICSSTVQSCTAAQFAAFLTMYAAGKYDISPVLVA